MSTLNHTKFDLLVINVFEGFVSPIILAYKLAIPYIQVSCIYSPWRLKIPVLPSFIPNLECKDCSEKMSFFQRFYNTYIFYTNVYTSLPEEDDFTIEWKRHFPHVVPPFINEVYMGAELMLYNTDPIMAYPYPSLQNVKFVGGLSIRQVQPLTSEFDEIMRTSDKVIIVSFGSGLTHLPKKHMDKLLHAFNQFEHTFLMKYGFSKRQFPPNVKVFDWIPQNDLLAHPTVKLFITHCGLKWRLCITEYQCWGYPYAMTNITMLHEWSTMVLVKCLMLLMALQKCLSI